MFTKIHIYLNKKKAKVAGIFKVGLDEYDSNFAFASLDFLQNLFKEETRGVDQICLKLKEEKDATLAGMGKTIKEVFAQKEPSVFIAKLFRQIQNYIKIENQFELTYFKNSIRYMIA